MLWFDIYNAKTKNQTALKVINEMQRLRQCLIISMFYDGYSLEDIIHIIGIDMKNLAKYITNEMIARSMLIGKKLYEGILCK